MWKYGVTSTALIEKRSLVEALKEIGYKVEVYAEGARLNSYYSGRE